MEPSSSSSVSLLSPSLLVGHDGQQDMVVQPDDLSRLEDEVARGVTANARQVVTADGQPHIAAQTELPTARPLPVFVAIEQIGAAANQYRVCATAVL